MLRGGVCCSNMAAGRGLRRSGPDLMHSSDGGFADRFHSVHLLHSNILSLFIPRNLSSSLQWLQFHEFFIHTANRCSHLRKTPPAAGWASCSGETRGKRSLSEQHSWTFKLLCYREGSFTLIGGFTFSSCVLACLPHFSLLFILTGDLKLDSRLS